MDTRYVVTMTITIMTISVTKLVAEFFKCIECQRSRFHFNDMIGAPYLCHMQECVEMPLLPQDIDNMVSPGQLPASLTCVVRK